MIDEILGSCTKKRGIKNVACGNFGRQASAPSFFEHASKIQPIRNCFGDVRDDQLKQAGPTPMPGTRFVHAQGGITK
jgi:hypothetical protein